MMQISAKHLKARLVSFAKEVGFDSCRVAACNAPAHANHFREWLRDGAHGEMNYMQRGEEKRCDPEKILPDAQSIVALALNYFQEERTHRRSETTATGKSLREQWERSRETISLSGWTPAEVEEGRICRPIPISWHLLLSHPPPA